MEACLHTSRINHHILLYKPHCEKVTLRNEFSIMLFFLLGVCSVIVSLANGADGECPFHKVSVIIDSTKRIDKGGFKTMRSVTYSILRILGKEYKHIYVSAKVYHSNNNCTWINETGHDYLPPTKQYKDKFNNLELSQSRDEFNKNCAEGILFSQYNMFKQYPRESTAGFLIAPRASLNVSANYVLFVYHNKSLKSKFRCNGDQDGSTIFSAATRIKNFMCPPPPPPPKPTTTHPTHQHTTSHTTVFTSTNVPTTSQPRACPEIDINYYGNNLGCVQNIKTWEECSAYCRGLPKCRYWTWITDRLPRQGKECCPKFSDEGKIKQNRMISGSMDCGQPGLSLQEVKFEGGKASASSIYDTSSNYIPSHAFQLAPTGFWQSGRNEKGEGDLAVPFPHTIWYAFPKPIIPGKVSFRPSPHGGNAENGFIGATKYQFVGTNDWPCGRYSRWTVLCEDMSGKLFERRTQSKYCTVDRHRSGESFRCLGINVLGSGYDGYVTVELTGIRMWKMA